MAWDVRGHPNWGKCLSPGACTSSSDKHTVLLFFTVCWFAVINPNRSTQFVLTRIYIESPYLQRYPCILVKREQEKQLWIMPNSEINKIPAHNCAFNEENCAFLYFIVLIWVDGLRKWIKIRICCICIAAYVFCIFSQGQSPQINKIK